MTTLRRGVRAIFPLPALQVPSPPASRSARSWQRHYRRTAATTMANATIAALNRMSSSSLLGAFHNSHNSHIDITTRTSHIYNKNRSQISNYPPLNSTQDRLINNIMYNATCYTLDCSRLHESDADLVDLVPEQPTLFGSPYVCKHPPLPIIASRVSLPEQCASANLTDLLAADVAAVYACPAQLLRPLQEVNLASLPAPRVFGSHGEYVQLVQRMLTVGMLALRTQARVVNGAFCTAKDDGTLRLIIDARAANSLFIDPPHVELPSPDRLVKLEADSGVPIFAAKRDLRNFYHTMRMPEAFVEYFALPPLRASELGPAASQFAPSELLYPCCTTLPMGFSHAVYLAQQAHLNLLYTATDLHEDDRVTATADVRLDRMRHVLCIDDLVLLGPDPRELALHLQQYEAAVAAKRLRINAAKSVDPTTEGIEIIGLQFHGRRHTLGVAPRKLAAMVASTRAILRAGRCTGHDLAQLLGRWAWVCLANRPAFSVFSAVYRFVACARSRLFMLWPSVRAELSTICALVPLLCVSLSAQWLPRMAACDASSSGQGVCSARAAQASLRAIAHLTGMPPPVDRKEPEARPEVERRVASTAWSTVIASPWRHDEHIAQLELTALTTTVRWALSLRDSAGVRFAVFSDSAPVVGATCKGRSSSFSLLHKLRRLAALLLASGMRLYLYWVPSHLNPADNPSRQYE